jgi:rhodanese-related sulfurtransferase
MKIRTTSLPLLAAGMGIFAFTSAALAQQPVGAVAAATPAPVASQPSPAEPRVITIEEVRERMDRGEKVLFVDARGTVSGPAIKGAAHVPPAEVEKWAADVKKDALVVAYCACATEGSSKAFVSRAQALGFTNAYALKGGINGWAAAGLPTE